MIITIHKKTVICTAVIYMCVASSACNHSSIIDDTSSVSSINEESSANKKEESWNSETKSKSTDSDYDIKHTEKIQYADHWYQGFDRGVSWTDAEQECKDMGGHLISINSKEEMDIALSIAKKLGKDNIWIGGKLDGDSWVWSDGSEFVYQNWDKREALNTETNEILVFEQPDNYDGTEEYIRFPSRYIEYPERNWWANEGKWNDTANKGDLDAPLSSFGYICEWVSNEQAEIETTLDPMEEAYKEKTAEHIDAEEYFESLADIVSVEKTSNNANNSEKNVCSLLAERNIQFDVLEYDIYENLKYLGTENITQPTDSVHPVYRAYYQNKRGDYYIIYVINGQVMVSPISFNLQRTRSVEIIISEKKEITSYDSATDSFYITEPNKDVIKVVVVDKITDVVLDKYSVEELNKIYE